VGAHGPTSLRPEVAVKWVRPESSRDTTRPASAL
jgi:hypothetical protein